MARRVIRCEIHWGEFRAPNLELTSTPSELDLNSPPQIWLVLVGSWVWALEVSSRLGGESELELASWTTNENWGLRSMQNKSSNSTITSNSQHIVSETSRGWLPLFYSQKLDAISHRYVNYMCHSFKTTTSSLQPNFGWCLQEVLH